MSPETACLGNSSRPQVAAEGLFETRKEAFLKKLGTAKRFKRFTGTRSEDSFLLTTW
jgi:hypothetical protein